MESASGCWKIVWNIAETIDHLGLRDLLVEVLRKMGAAALPRRTGQHFGNCVLDAFVGVTSDQKDTGQSPGFQVLEEAFPRRVGLSCGDVHAEHFPVPIGVDPGS